MAKSLSSGRPGAAFKSQPAPRRVSQGTVSKPKSRGHGFSPESDPGRSLRRVKLT
jgi:hypothetical protein